MNLVMLTASLDPSSQAEGFIVDWVEALAREVDHLTVIVTKKPKIRLKHTNITVRYLKKKGKINRFLELWQHLSRLKKDGKVNVVFTHIFNFLGLVGGLWGKYYGIKTVMWFAGGTPIRFLDMNWLALALNGVIVTCSKTEKIRYQKLLGKNKKIQILGHGINLNRFQGIRHPRNQKIFNIGYAARVTPIKNFETLILAVEQLHKRFSLELHFALADCNIHPEYVKKIETLASQSNVPIHLNFNLTYPKMPAFYKKLDLYVHPSKMLSIDKAALEAVAANTPVLLSSFGFRDVLSPSSPILFDPTNPTELAIKIETYLTRPQQYSKDNEALKLIIFQQYSLESLMKKLQLELE